MTPDLVPLFFSDHAEEPEQPGIGKAWDRAVIASRILKTSILFATAAIVFAVLLAGNPLALFPNTTAAVVGTSAPRDGTTQSMPIIQSNAGAQALPPTATEAPTGDEIAGAVKPAYRSQTEIRQPPAEALFRQFQAWAAEEDARAQVGPVQPAQGAPAQAPPAQKRRHVRSEQKARHVRSEQKARHVRSAQRARQLRPEQNADAEDRPVQNAQAKTWPERHFGWLY
jgi:hypothetical protein